MKKQNQSLVQSDSRKRVANIFQEEEKLSKAFELSNFYTNQRLNIVELKQRLEQFKKTQKFLPGIKPSETPERQQPAIFNKVLPEELERESGNGNSTAKYTHSSQRRMTAVNDNKPLRVNNKNTVYGAPRQQVIDQIARQTVGIEQAESLYNIERKQEVRQANYRIVREIRKSRYESKTKTAFGLRHASAEPQNNLSIITRLNKNNKKSRVQKTEYSKCSNSSFNQSWEELGIEGRIKVQSMQHMNSVQKQIHHLWQHYQLLTKILLGLREGNRQQKNTIVKYIEDACTDKFQFVRELLLGIQRENPSKQQASFIKRIRKAIIQSKLYENLSIIYVGLEICLQQQADSNLVNFIGYCCSNVIFLLRFVELSHSLWNDLHYSSHTENILAVISQFEADSYKSIVERMGDLVLRMEHNNQVISKVHSRICARRSKEFQQTISSLLKNVDIETKPLLEYAHYIYQFLAFQLAKMNIIGQFSFVEMAPSPYLNLPKQKTLVIEPWEVLFAQRGENSYIRAYSQTFLTEVAKSWNIVYWTDLMPHMIDDLLLKLPNGGILYRYHCRFENERFLKLLWRIGCDVDNTIIFDRQEANFKYDREMGLQIPWRGKNKDTKLIELLKILHPILGNNSASLRASFPAIKQQFLQQKKSRNKKRVDVKPMGLPPSQSLYPRQLLRR